MAEVVVTKGRWFEIRPDGRVVNESGRLVPRYVRAAVLRLARCRGRVERAERWWDR